MAQHTGTITGAVLAGGLSSRMGADKALLRLGDGCTFLERAVSLLKAVCGQVLVVGRQAPELEQIAGVHCLDDERPGCGPAGGLLTALRYSAADCLVLSCDMPFMDLPTLQELLAAWEKRKSASLACNFIRQNDGQIENLVGIYSHKAVPLLEHALDSDQLKLSLIFPAWLRETITYQRESSRPFMNINHPEDLRQARALLNIAGTIDRS